MSRKPSANIGSTILKVLGRIVAFLVGLILCLPAFILPITTAVPTALWIVLAILGLVLLILQFRQPVAGLAGTLAVCILTVILSQVFAATPPIKDAHGAPLPGSIATLEKVNLNGTEQWITVRGHDVTKPVLLYLGMGGPGGGSFATRGLFTPLEGDFVVVAWDEPGTGKSYNAMPISELTPQRFIEDAHALTLMLRERFHQDKIYLYGVSWTSILGIWLIQQYPDLYYAYIGNGQMVNTTENDVMGYNLALQYLKDKGDTAMLQTLQKNGPPPYTGKTMLGRYVAYIDVLNDYMNSPRYALVVPIVPLFAPEYGWVDKINHTRGLLDSFPMVYPQLTDLDFTTQAAKLQVPVYIFLGRHDVNAMTSLVERYYNVLEAPHKELIWLDAGHGLDESNMPIFMDTIVNKILPETYPAGE
jgi:pimeloyl-ACP methyl ester carboxylesterase